MVTPSVGHDSGVRAGSRIGGRAGAFPVAGTSLASQQLLDQGTRGLQPFELGIDLHQLRPQLAAQHITEVLRRIIEAIMQQCDVLQWQAGLIQQHHLADIGSILGPVVTIAIGCTYRVKQSQSFIEAQHAHTGLAGHGKFADSHGLDVEEVDPDILSCFRLQCSGTC